MVDAHTVDKPLAEPTGDFRVVGVEHHAIVLAQPGQRGDREETPISDDSAAPAHQPVVLTVVHLRPGAVAGARGNRQHQVAQPQLVSVDLQVGDVIVGTQHRQHDPALLVQVPVDVEKRCVGR